MGVICGYCAMGSVVIATRPAIVMTMEMTAEKMGRSMKKWEIISAAPTLFFLGLNFAADAPGFGSRLGFRGPLDDLDRSTGPEPQDSVHDHHVSRSDPAGDEPVVSLPGPDLDGARLDLAVLVDDPDELTLRPLQHGALRHEYRVGPDKTLHAYAHELPRPQACIGIFHRGTDEKRAGLLVEVRIGK